MSIEQFIVGKLIYLHYLCIDKLHLGRACKQACISALGLHYLFFIFLSLDICGTE